MEDLDIAMQELRKMPAKKAVTAKKRFDPPFIPMTRIEVEEALRISRSKIYEMINPEHARYDPSFPKPMQWGAKRVMWRQDEIAQWMLTRGRTHVSEEEE